LHDSEEARSEDQCLVQEKKYAELYIANEYNAKVKTADSRLEENNLK
jgi:hypothetical protein